MQATQNRSNNAAVVAGTENKALLSKITLSAAKSLSSRLSVISCSALSKNTG